MVVKRLLWVVILILPFGIGAVFAQSPPPSGIIGWWAGDGDFRDSSGNGNNASPAGGNSAPTFSIGEVGQTFALNGALFNSLQFASIPDSPSIRLQSLTIEGWGKLTSVDNAAPTFFGKGLGTGNGDSYIVWYQSGTLHGAICNLGGCLQIDAPSFSLNVWHHIAFTFDDPGGATTKTAVLYIDGVSVASNTTTGVVGYDTHAALIGGDYDFEAIRFGWTGGIDEVTLYNRALSLAEIQAIKNAGINGKTKRASTSTGTNIQTVVNDATISFENVSAAGTTTDYTIDPTTAGTVPPGYTHTGLGYQISTTAVYPGLITECFHIVAITDNGIFNNLRVLHSEGGILIDKTTTHDPATRMVCGQTTSLSPFVIATGPAISGTVTYGNALGSPTPPRFVSNVLVSAAGSPNVSTTTSFPGGVYSLSGFGAGAYTVTPSKTGGVNGSITSFDAAKIAQHVAGTSLLTGNQLVVADVSGNNQVTSFDAGQIALFVAAGGGMQTGTWKFVPVNKSYASIAANVAGEDYTALLIGEVSGNWTNTGARPEISDRSKSSIRGPERRTTVRAPQLVTSTEKEFVIPVSVEGTEDKGIISYEFDLRYDPSIIRPDANPVDIAGTLSSRLSVVANTDEAGLLRVVVYGPIPIDGDGVLLNLRFTTVGAPGAASPLTWQRFVFNEGGSRIETIDGRIEISAAPSETSF